MAILVVDDDAVSRDAIAHALEQAGYEVVTAADGWQALDILIHSNCQLVITDWLMPEINGVGLCRMIRGLDYGRYIYVIVTSSLSDPRDAILAVSSGANNFVAKPFDRQELLDAVAQGELVIQTTSDSRPAEQTACRG
jgi:DNA-binding response OmpR family regulator